MRLFKLEIKGYSFYLDDSMYETTLDICKNPDGAALKKLMELSHSTFKEGRLIKLRGTMPTLEQIFDAAFRLDEDLCLKS